MARPEAPHSAQTPDHRDPDILLVNSDNTLAPDYRPTGLVNLYEQRDRSFLLARSDIEVCEIVYEAMNEMFAAANAAGVDGFVVTSGYRDYARQTEIYDQTTDNTAQIPGASEHQTGLAFDVSAMSGEPFESTPQCAWLQAHCGDYGFILRYPKGAESVTGIPYEPWHYRYVGAPYARDIMDAGIALEEYLSRRR
jgi:D-alanyl-D-alanine carboxypeptidase